MSVSNLMLMLLFRKQNRRRSAYRRVASGEDCVAVPATVIFTKP